MPPIRKISVTGQVPSLLPHLSYWGAPRFPKQRPSGGNGNTPPGSFPSRTPRKPRSPGGRKFQLGPRPSPPRFSLRLAAPLAPMPPSLIATSGWQSSGGGGELRGSGQGYGAGKYEPWVGKKKRALPTFLREEFSQGVLFVSPGVRCRRGGRACTPCPAPPPTTRGSSSASRRGAKWLPSQPHGAGAAAPPPTAAAPGARGLGAGTAGGSALAVTRRLGAGARAAVRRAMDGRAPNARDTPAATPPPAAPVGNKTYYSNEELCL
ncbi:translation initiation factor IF-2-like [Rhinolophus ferrumequinum]|uniref:translation initiation factor IF-2-like n=1 Tax=Rhinolophus ferrumequinum TaxID=59479 RepID=UPI00140F63B1|nr:translation initiation factor IF-2-like [Rhinolophus ferrumequinum]